MYRVFVPLFLAVSIHAGVLVSRSEKGLQFAEATSVLVNGKDKAIILGSQPALPNRAGKMSSVHLAGTLLKDGDANTIARYSDGEIEYLLPEGLPKNAVRTPSAAWSTANISYKKSASDKDPTDISASKFVAFLPGGVEELTQLCMNARELQLLGGKGKTFPTQLEFLLATKPYSSEPATAPLKRFVEQGMRQRYQSFESGAAGLEVLGEAMKLTQVSSALYPNDSEQDELRHEVADKKDWFSSKMAILRAFLAAHEWDPYLLAARDMEKYQQSFPEIQKAHTEALKASLEYHRDSAEKRLKDRELGGAYREFRVASRLQPSDKILQQKVLMTWTDYSREVAIDHKTARTQLSPGQRGAMNQALRFAQGYKEENKLDLALKSVLDAEMIDPDSLEVLLKKAEILGARREYAKALATLDQYDLRAVDDERDRASNLQTTFFLSEPAASKILRRRYRRHCRTSNFIGLTS